MKLQARSSIGWLSALLLALGCSGQARSGGSGAPGSGASAAMPDAGAPSSPGFAGTAPVGSAGVATGGTSAVDPSTEPEQPEVPAEPGAGELARPSDTFLDMVGVNGHLNYEGSAYSDHFEAVSARVAELGIRHWRDALNVAPATLARQQAWRRSEFAST